MQGTVAGAGGSKARRGPGLAYKLMGDNPEQTGIRDTVLSTFSEEVRC